MPTRALLQGHRLPFQIPFRRPPPLPSNPITQRRLLDLHHHRPRLHPLLYVLRRPALPNQCTLATLFKTCASLPSLPAGLQLHSLALKLSFAHLPCSGSALVWVGLNCRIPDDALKEFDKMPHKDEVCYSAAIVGLAQNGRPADAISVFAGMRLGSVVSNTCSVSDALRATAEVAPLEHYRVLHAHATVAGLKASQGVWRMRGGRLVGCCQVRMLFGEMR